MVIRGIEAMNVRETRAKLSHPSNVIAGAQAFDAELGKLAESVLTPMAPWLKVRSDAREGSGRAAGRWKP
jgi:hypothetical protein